MNPPEYSSWINKEEIYFDKLTEVNINRLYYTLNLPGNPPTLGNPVFPLSLLILGEPSVRPDELGEDGHPERGGFMPPVPLKRRMFAGGDYRFFQPLNVGDNVNVSWKITDISLKTGSSGELVFVNILKTFIVNQKVCATENRHIVYTDSKPKTGQTDEIETPGEWEETIYTNSIQLFRYSALTFNGHRIHYDRTYATELEGYPGLVIQGPLLATMLSLFAERHTGRKLSKFSFRGKRPVFDLNGFTLTGGFSGKDSAEFRVLDHKSQLSMSAEAEFL
tara:strand:+ start:374 stop:1207 length:834 start_codon:yes stop_codon:yes gene_type:complete